MIRCFLSPLMCQSRMCCQLWLLKTCASRLGLVRWMVVGSCCTSLQAWGGWCNCLCLVVHVKYVLSSVVVVTLFLHHYTNNSWKPVKCLYYWLCHGVLCSRIHCCSRSSTMSVKWPDRCMRAAISILKGQDTTTCIYYRIRFNFHGVKLSQFLQISSHPRKFHPAKI